MLYYPQKAKGEQTMKVAYVRVSTIEQNEARQKEALSKHGIEKWYIDKASGKNMDRPQLKEMLDFVRAGDIVYIHDLSRIARSTSDLLQIVDQLQSKGVDLMSNKESIDTTTSTGKLMLTMIGAINEFERENLLERQREGIAIAKAAGKYKGRKEIKIDNFAEHYSRYQSRQVTKVQLAKELEISRVTLDKLIAQYKGGQQ